MKKLDKNTKFSFQEQISDILENRIIDGKYKVGEKLPSLRIIGNEFSVSHETAKGALSLLQNKGLLEIIPSKGAFVSSSKYKRKPSGLIAVVIDTGEGTTPKNQLDILFSKIFEVMHSELNKYGWHPLTSYVCYKNLESRNTFISLLEKVDGLILANLIEPELLALAKSRHVPVVSLLPAIHVDYIDQVDLHFEKIFFDTTKRFIELGYRKITFMENIKYFESAENKQNGIKKAIAESAFQNDIIFDRIDLNSWKMNDYENAVEDWLKKGQKSDVLICSNDNMAIAALKVFRKNKVKVPEQIKLIGTRNTSACEASHPTLSSIDYRYDRLIELASKRLKERIMGDEGPYIHSFILGELIERETTKQ
ncbi:MAG: LacI family transcriptional regulator [Spirochaetia bacterium]|nr:LacI family transcriptional regulator [Spirochaetia bacterium]